jgi:O-antigen/teichoic acid export membrane protein
MTENSDNTVMTKRSRKKATFWHLVFSYSTIVYAIVSGLLMVPLYLKYIPVELYGAWLATGNIINWLLVVDPGISTVVMQRVGKSYGADDRSEVGEYATGGLLITGVIVLVVLIAGLVSASQVGSWVNLTDLALATELESNFKIAVFASALTLFAFAAGSVNLGLQASFAHGICYLIANTISLVTTAVGLLQGWGLLAITIGLLVRAVIFCGGGLGYMLWRFHEESVALSCCRERIYEILGLMSFTSLGRIGALLTKNMDAFVLARFLGPEMVPVLILTRRGFEVAEMVLTRTGNAVGPSLSHLKGEDDRGKMRSIITRLLSLNVWVLGLAFGGYLAFNDDFIYLWVGAEFFAGATVSYLLCILLVFTVMVTLMQTLCMALGDIKRNSVMQFVRAFITFVCLIGGVYAFGIIGAVIAPLVGIVVIASWYYPRSLGRLAGLLRSDWLQLGREAVISLVCSLVLFALFMEFEPITWSNFCLNAGAMAGLYTILLFSVSRLAREEGIGFLSLLHSKMSRLLGA